MKFIFHHPDIKDIFYSNVSDRKCVFVTFLHIPARVVMASTYFHPGQSGSSTELSAVGAKRDVENSPKLYPGPMIQSRPCRP